MGTLLRHGSDAQKRAFLPEIASGRAAAAGVRRHRADDRLRHDAAEDHGDPRTGDRYIVRGQKVWISRAEHSDLLLLVVRTTPVGAGEEADRRPVDPARRSARGGRPRPDDPPDPHDDESRDDRAVLRRPRGARRRAGRRRGQGVPVSARRAERGADPDRRRVRRRRALVHRAVDALREGPRRLQPPDRPEPGRAVPDRAGARQRRGRPT